MKHSRQYQKVLTLTLSRTQASDLYTVFNSAKAAQEPCRAILQDKQSHFSPHTEGGIHYNSVVWVLHCNTVHAYNPPRDPVLTSLGFHSHPGLEFAAFDNSCFEFFPFLKPVLNWASSSCLSLTHGRALSDYNL